ncbi:MAG TPA: MFS transporter, partial [Mycobacteriales bacterium]|nr:MFS transporter [Mycobacteriales bacterium]
RGVGRRFWRVWAGESLSGVGDAVFLVAFAWAVLAATGSAGVLAGTLIAGAVPRGILLLVGGAVVDRVSARAALLGAHLVRGTVIGALAIAVAAGTRPWVFVAAAVAVGAADAFAGPAGVAVLPALVPAPQLARANALVATGEQVALSAGPLAAGALIALAGPAVALAVDAGTFAVAAVTVLAAPAVRTAADSPLWTDIGAGLRWAARTAEVRAVLIVVAAATLSYAGLFGVGLPALARSTGGALGLGVLLSAWGVGQLVGSVAAGITGLPRRWGRLIGLMSLAEAAVFTTVGLTREVAVAAVLLALLGVGVAYTQDVALPTWLQTRTPPDRLGRTSSLLHLARTALEPVSLAGTGLLAAVDVRLAFAAAAVPVLATGAWLLATPTTRALGTAPPGAATPRP